MRDVGGATTALAGECNHISAVSGCKLLFGFCFFHFINKGGRSSNQSRGDRGQRGRGEWSLTTHRLSFRSIKNNLTELLQCLHLLVAKVRCDTLQYHILQNQFFSLYFSLVYQVFHLYQLQLGLYFFQQ